MPDWRQTRRRTGCQARHRFRVGPQKHHSLYVSGAVESRAEHQSCHASQCETGSAPKSNERRPHRRRLECLVDQQSEMNALNRYIGNTTVEHHRPQFTTFARAHIAENGDVHVAYGDCGL